MVLIALSIDDVAELLLLVLVLAEGGKFWREILLHVEVIWRQISRLHCDKHTRGSNELTTLQPERPPNHQRAPSTTRIAEDCLQHYPCCIRVILAQCSWPPSIMTMFMMCLSLFDRTITRIVALASLLVVLQAFIVMFHFMMFLLCTIIDTKNTDLSRHLVHDA